MQFAPTEARLIKVLNAAMAAFGQGLYDSIRKPNGSYFHVYEDISELENYCDFTITDNDYWDIVYECLEEAVKKPMTYYKQPIDYLCSHKEAKGEIMWAFVVPHDDFKTDLYVKFTLIDTIDGKKYIHIDCHP